MNENGLHQSPENSGELAIPPPPDRARRRAPDRRDTGQPQQSAVNQSTPLAVQLTLPQWEMTLAQLARGSIAEFGALFAEIRQQLEGRLRADG
jgi:hypothetical protein